MRLVLPLIAGIECGSFIVLVTPVMPVHTDDLSKVTMKSLQELKYESSPLPHFPYLRNIKPENLLRLSYDGEWYAFLMDSHKLVQPYQTSREVVQFSRCLMRIPINEKEPLSVYSYPDSHEMRSKELLKLIDKGIIDGNAKKGSDDANYGEDYFTAHGWRFKVISYFSKRNKSGKGSKRLNMLYRSNDDLFQTDLKFSPTLRKSICDPKPGEKEKPLRINSNSLVVCEQIAQPFSPHYSLLGFGDTSANFKLIYSSIIGQMKLYLE